MELISFEERLERQFEAFCKAVTRNKARDIQRALARQATRETEFSAMAAQQLDSLSYDDEYFTRQFSVLGVEVDVRSELVAEALDMLSEDRRRIILLYYFRKMNDREIGEAMHLIRETVQYRRTSSLGQLRKILEGKSYEPND